MSKKFVRGRNFRVSRSLRSTLLAPQVGGNGKGLMELQVDEVIFKHFVLDFLASFTAAPVTALPLYNTDSLSLSMVHVSICSIIIHQP